MSRQADCSLSASCWHAVVSRSDVRAASVLISKAACGSTGSHASRSSPRLDASSRGRTCSDRLLGQHCLLALGASGKTGCALFFGAKPRSAGLDRTDRCRAAVESLLRKKQTHLDTSDAMRLTRPTATSKQPWSASEMERMGVALALVASLYVPWLRPAQATITTILFAFVGVLGALVGRLIYIVFSGGDPVGLAHFGRRAAGGWAPPLRAYRHAGPDGDRSRAAHAPEAELLGPAPLVDALRVVVEQQQAVAAEAARRAPCMQRVAFAPRESFILEQYPIYWITWRSTPFSLRAFATCAVIVA